MRIPAWLERWGENVIVPAALVIIYALFVITAGVKGAALVVAGMFLVGVVFLWFAFQRLKLHAQASRLAGVGDGDALLALAERELPRCLTESRRRPLRLHAAIAHNLRGDFAAARRELDASGFLSPAARRDRRGRGWLALAAATDVATRTEQGDLEGARASYEQLVPFAAIAPFGGMELLAREAEARILLAAGDPAGARERLAPLVKNIRLMDGARGQIHALLARAATAMGDDAEAQAQRAKARELAPKLKLPA